MPWPNCFSVLIPAALFLTSIPVHAQFARQAQAAIQGAVKLSIKPPQVSPMAGDAIDFALQIQNGRSEPAWLPTETHIQVQLLGSSNDVIQQQSCSVPARSTDARCSMTSPKAGLYKVRAAPSDRQLSEASGFVLVRPNTRKVAAPVRKQAMHTGAYSLFTLVAYRPDDEGSESGSTNGTPAAVSGACGATKSPGTARVLLTINEGGEPGGAFRAGLENATIQTFFQSDDGGTAPSDIRVWLSPNHGEVDHQPLLIPKCGISAEAQLLSKYPVNTAVVYKVLPAIYAVAGAPTTLEASFVRPIIGIGIIPDGTQTLSLIDNVPLVAQFFDANGDVTSTDSDRTVTFVSNNSVISPKQQTVTVKAGEYSAATIITPFWLGTGTIFVSADHLKTASHEIAVIGWLVITVCLLGGIVGGVVSFLVSGGKVYTRIVVGVAAGIVLAWAYVFGLLPKTDASVAHNYISVFVVSILGGYFGIKVFDAILKRLGWIDNLDAPEAGAKA